MIRIPIVFVVGGRRRRRRRRRPRRTKRRGRRRPSKQWKTIIGNEKNEEEILEVIVGCFLRTEISKMITIIFT